MYTCAPREFRKPYTHFIYYNSPFSRFPVSTKTICTLQKMYYYRIFFFCYNSRGRSKIVFYIVHYCTPLPNLYNTYIYTYVGTCMHNADSIIVYMVKHFGRWSLLMWESSVISRAVRRSNPFDRRTMVNIDEGYTRNVFRTRVRV